MKKLFYLLSLLLAALLVSCSSAENENKEADDTKDPLSSDKVETGAHENISQTSATLKGIVNVDIAAYNSIEFGIMYDSSLDEVKNRSAHKVKGRVLHGTNFSVDIAGLSAKTKYYYCAYVLLNNMQYVYGSVEKFTTLASSDKPSDFSSAGSFVAKPFSVAADKTVTFSPGNLQYHAASNEWRFALNQTDYIGEVNENISSTYNGWIDLFGWGTGNNPTNRSTDYDDYRTFVDWGVNKIGNDAPNTWRTLTIDEWIYILKKRYNYDRLIGIAEVKGVKGLILLPDGWICPSGVIFKCGLHDDEYYTEYQTFNSSEWDELEASGAVFLPLVGRNSTSNVNEVLYRSRYWSSSPYGSAEALSFKINTARVRGENDARYDAYFVRLVQD